MGGCSGGLVDGRREKVCPGCMTETVRCKMLILSRGIGSVGEVVVMCAVMV